MKGLLATALIGIALAAPGVASASSGPVALQVAAAAQTAYLFAHFTANGQSASPATCGEDQPRSGFLGVFLLPTLSFYAGDQDFTCKVSTHTVLLDLGGAVATEDANDAGWTMLDGSELLFRPRNLERICDDVWLQFYPRQLSDATLDGRAITGTAVTTAPFPVPIRRSEPLNYWEDSVAVGHPGVLAATYCGWKTLLTLPSGRHVVKVDLTQVTGGDPTRFTYDITVS